MTAAIATPPLTFIFPRELSYLSRVAASRHRTLFPQRCSLARSHAKVFSLRGDVSDFFQWCPVPSLMAFRYAAAGQTMATQFCKTLLTSFCGF